jgi:hypothetical protein
VAVSTTVTSPTHPCCISPCHFTCFSNSHVFSSSTGSEFDFFSMTYKVISVVLVDSGALLSILPHAFTEPPTGGSQWQYYLGWGFHQFYVCFSGHIFEFNFLLAAEATPLLGMDVTTKFGLPSSALRSRFCTRLLAAPFPGQVLLLS